MKKIHVLTTAGILLALAGSSAFAATRAHRAVDAYASGAPIDRSGAYNYGPQGGAGVPVETPAQHNYVPQAGQNLPYADRPYGDPDRW